MGLLRPRSIGASLTADCSRRAGAPFCCPRCMLPAWRTPACCGGPARKAGRRQTTRSERPDRVGAVLAESGGRHTTPFPLPCPGTPALADMPVARAASGAPTCRLRRRCLQAPCAFDGPQGARLQRANNQQYGSRGTGRQALQRLLSRCAPTGRQSVVGPRRPLPGRLPGETAGQVAGVRTFLVAGCEKPPG